MVVEECVLAPLRMSPSCIRYFCGTEARLLGIYAILARGEEIYRRAAQCTCRADHPGECIACLRSERQRARICLHASVNRTSLMKRQ